MLQREISGGAGRLEVLIDEPAEGTVLRAAVVLAHPHPLYGGTMHTKAVYHAAKAFSRIGCAVLRFNFRGTKQAGALPRAPARSLAGAPAPRSASSQVRGAHLGSTFDNGAGEVDDFTASVDFMCGRYPSLPVWAAGMSFGSWIAMATGAADVRVSTLVGIAMPVPRYDFEAVRQSTKPKFFVHGERDEVCSLREIRRFYARAEEPKELAVIDAADHLFDGKASELGDAIEELLGDWEQ